jgi:hypothetical protein
MVQPRPHVPSGAAALFGLDILRPECITTPYGVRMSRHIAKSAGKTAPKSQKTKITVSINKKIFDRFCSTTKELGLRRDTYLNQVLPEEINFFSTNAPAGSEQGELLLQKLRSAQKETVKVGITLDMDVAKEMTETCSEKHVLRDVFIEACLTHLDDVLGKAAVLIMNPRTHGDRNTYAGLAVNDEAVASVLRKLTSH